jgi:leucyl aminopeptidase
VTVELIDEKKARALGMGTFLAVASGSEEEAYMIHLTYKPKNKTAKKVAICGKGITFDSGGLSLKTGVHMDNMKMDMAGGAMILGLFSQLPTLKPNVEVHGVIAATENMPGCGAMRPGDVVTAYNGQTVEIINTDAEGRLVLSDALSWAEATIKPDYMYDVATLTGSAISALGQQVAAVMGSNQKAIDMILAAGKATGEQHWQLPMPDEYKHLLESKVADVANLPGPYWAGAIMGGMFLRTFVKDTPWAHIDIAGPAWADRQVYSYEPYGGTGFGIRTFAEYLDQF